MSATRHDARGRRRSPPCCTQQWRANRCTKKTSSRTAPGGVSRWNPSADRQNTHPAHRWPRRKTSRSPPIAATTGPPEHPRAGLHVSPSFDQPQVVAAADGREAAPPREDSTRATRGQVEIRTRPGQPARQGGDVMPLEAGPLHPGPRPCGASRLWRPEGHAGRRATRPPETAITRAAARAAKAAANRARDRPRPSRTGES